VDLASKALVGHFQGHIMGMDKLKEWINVSWKLVLGYSPKVFVLVRGWMGFIFQLEEYVKKVLKSMWK
jgi:hypothetical protein